MVCLVVVAWAVVFVGAVVVSEEEEVDVDVVVRKVIVATLVVVLMYVLSSVIVVLDVGCAAWVGDGEGGAGAVDLDGTDFGPQSAMQMSDVHVSGSEEH